MLTRGAASPSAPVRRSTRHDQPSVFSKDATLPGSAPTAASFLAADATATIVRNEPVCLCSRVPHGTPAGGLAACHLHPGRRLYRSASSWACITRPGLDPGGLAFPRRPWATTASCMGRERGSPERRGVGHTTSQSPAARDNALQAAADLLPSRARLAPRRPVLQDRSAHVALYGLRRVEMPLPYPASSWLCAGVMDGTADLSTVLQKTKPSTPAARPLLGESLVGANDRAN